ncbi:OmpA family protein [Streptomyces albidus (ex Kaewkla and Franco 2022)]|uniref:OmpA family protein n=1 Tax=Streptomyces albidus (ex Kaewkla and Franco 2022) TaxID=722709 RepID=UPI002815785B|nr:OmpA family protein [Streptomyces albidus (ex Kaewkla and Franco 2022)]
MSDRTSRPRAHALRTVVCTSASALLLTAFSTTGARADDPSPKPTISVPSGPTSLPGADDPTTIPTEAAPSLPGEGGAAPAPDYSEPPDNIGDSEPPVDLDPQAAGLRLADGANLAPSKVLDIKFVTEDLSGEERREDSTGKTKFTLQAEVLFPKDSSKLDSGAESRIQDIVEEVNKQKAKEINVFGFTDDLGSYEHGKKLSKKRADAVQQALAQELGSAFSFNVRGYSEDYPIADNRSEDGRKKNRRVEVSFARQ